MWLEPPPRQGLPWLWRRDPFLRWGSSGAASRPLSPRTCVARSLSRPTLPARPLSRPMWAGRPLSRPRGPRGPPAVQRVWHACVWSSLLTGRRDQAVVAGPTGSPHRLVSDCVARTLCRCGRARGEATAWLCAGRSSWVTSFRLSGPLWAGQAEGTTHTGLPFDSV